MEKIIKLAEEEAEEIIKKAKQEAEKIVLEAKKDIEEKLKKLEDDIRKEVEIEIKKEYSGLIEKKLEKLRKVREEVRNKIYDIIKEKIISLNFDLKTFTNNFMEVVKKYGEVEYLEVNKGLAKYFSNHKVKQVDDLVIKAYLKNGLVVFYDLSRVLEELRYNIEIKV